MGVVETEGTNFRSPLPQSHFCNTVIGVAHLIRVPMHDTVCHASPHRGGSIVAQPGGLLLVSLSTSDLWCTCNCLLHPGASRGDSLEGEGHGSPWGCFVGCGIFLATPRQTLVYAINNSLIHWWYPWSSLELTGTLADPRMR